MQLCRAGVRGTVHVTNSGHCSWYEFAQELVRGAGVTEVTVKPIGTDESSRPAARPKNSVLSNGSLQRLYGISLRTWQEAVRVYLHEKRHDCLVQERRALAVSAGERVMNAEGGKS
jgi:dTDP-4-dehydrorhamnose reductase